jgi:hypothetical protein
MRVKQPTVGLGVISLRVVSAFLTLLVCVGEGSYWFGSSAASTTSDMSIIRVKSKMIDDSVHGEVLSRVSDHVGYVVHISWKLV